MSLNLLTVVVFGAMWLAMAGFFFVVVRFILVNQAKRDPGDQRLNAEADADAEVEARDFEFGL